MARSLTAVPLSMVAGCFHAAPYSPEHTEWRSVPPLSHPTGPDSATSPPKRLGPGLDAAAAYALALQSNTELTVLHAQAEVAQGEIAAARQLENPELRITSFNIDDVVVNQTAINIGLRVPIPRPGTVKAKVASARSLAQAQGSEVDRAKWELRNLIWQHFATLALLQADHGHAGRVSGLRATQVQVIEARLEQGVGTKLDLAVAQIELAEARDEEAQIAEATHAIHRELRRLTGARGETHFVVARDELEVPALDLDRNVLIERAMEARHELRSGHARVSASQAEVHLQRAQTWPWFQWAQAQYLAGPASTAASWGFGVAITLPVLSWNRGGIGIAKARVREAQVQQQSQVFTIATEIDEAIARIERTSARVRELESGLLATVGHASEEAASALSTDAIDPLLANSIALRGEQARRVHVAAQYAHRQAVIDLERVVGDALPGARDPS